MPDIKVGDPGRCSRHLPGNQGAQVQHLQVQGRRLQGPQ